MELWFLTLFVSGAMVLVVSALVIAARFAVGPLAAAVTGVVVVVP